MVPYIHNFKVTGLMCQRQLAQGRCLARSPTSGILIASLVVYAT